MSAPASTCTRCRTPGSVAALQLDINGNQISANHIRFVCLNCLNEWNVLRREADQQGRFLDKAGLR